MMTKFKYKYTSLFNSLMEIEWGTSLSRFQLSWRLFQRTCKCVVNSHKSGNTLLKSSVSYQNLAILFFYKNKIATKYSIFRKLSLFGDFSPKKIN